MNNLIKVYHKVVNPLQNFIITTKIIRFSMRIILDSKAFLANTQSYYLKLTKMKFFVLLIFYK